MKYYLCADSFIFALMDIAFFDLPWWLIWLFLAIVLTIIEICTFMVFGLCLAIGSLCAMLAALCGAGIQVQLLVMALGTLLSFAAIKPMMNKIKERRKKEGKVNHAASNMDALIGQQVTLTGDATRAKIYGDNWQIRSSDGSQLSAGEKVEVVGHDSIILIVKPI